MEGFKRANALTILISRVSYMVSEAVHTEDLEVVVMKARLYGVAAAALTAATLLAAPLASYAQQSNNTVTRAQVKAELAELERAGYHPGMNEVNYPVDLETAEAKVAANHAGAPGDTGYGAGTTSSAQSGGQ